MDYNRFVDIVCAERIGIAGTKKGDPVFLPLHCHRRLTTFLLRFLYNYDMQVVYFGIAKYS